MQVYINNVTTITWVLHKGSIVNSTGTERNWLLQIGLILASTSTPQLYSIVYVHHCQLLYMWTKLVVYRHCTYLHFEVSHMQGQMMLLQCWMRWANALIQSVCLHVQNLQLMRTHANMQRPVKSLQRTGGASSDSAELTSDPPIDLSQTEKIPIAGLSSYLSANLFLPQTFLVSEVTPGLTVYLGRKSRSQWLY